jgi:Lamin Tail Domain/HYR domain
MRSRSWLVAVFVVMAVQMSPVLEKVSAQSRTSIVVSELRFSGPNPNGDTNEFVELFNAGDTEADLSGWLLRAALIDGRVATRATLRTGTKVQPGCYFLITNSTGYSLGVPGDHTYSLGFANDGGVAITLPSLLVIDQVGFDARNVYKEIPTIAPVADFMEGSWERGPGGEYGHADTNNNAADFHRIDRPNPQNSRSTCLDTSLKPHDVQGSGAMSPMVGTVKSVKGVVTARARNGFFIQTEFGEEDQEPNSSEGLFVFTGVGVTVPENARVGHLVRVTGTVEEFVPASDPGSASRTQLRLASLADLGTAPMPNVYVLTLADLSDAGALDQLERLEGMRVTAPSLTAVSRTAADGGFYAVLTEQFNDNGDNPERLRVDSDGVEGIDAVDVSTEAVMSDVTGPLHFESRTYTLLPEAALVPFYPPDVRAPVIDPAAAVPAVEATGPEGAAVRFPTPGATDNRDDVVTVTCTPASGSVFGLGNSAVTCSAVDQAGNAAKDVRFTVIVQDTTAPVITVPDAISEQATSPAGNVITYNATAHDAVSGSLVASCSPASGYTFPIGTTVVTCSAIDVAGNKAEDVGFTVTVQDTIAPVITVPDDISEEATSAAGRVVTYNATAHDTVSGSLVVTCFPVSGSLFPLDNTRVTCSASDVAGNLAEASFTVTVADTTAPVFNPTTEAVTAEATGPTGAMVNYPVPTATDNVDAVVVLTCSPASGSVFQLGTTTGGCSASDAAGNHAYVWFTVIVEDTTGPAIAVPDDISAQATSSAGRVITYDVTAYDVVSGSAVASCSPASGSPFPIGTTQVECVASDALGHEGKAFFSVSISQPLQGRMHGAGSVASGQQRVSFTFDAGESANEVDRGWLMMLVKDGAGRPRSYAGKVDTVAFSNAEGYMQGQWPASGIDTVVFSGVGWWNGRSGYSFRVTASDRGEPGVNIDTFEIVVTSPTGEVVESASGVLRGGNIQSLR